PPRSGRLRPLLLRRRPGPRAGRRRGRPGQPQGRRPARRRRGGRRGARRLRRLPAPRPRVPHRRRRDAPRHRRARRLDRGRRAAQHRQRRRALPLGPRAAHARRLREPQRQDLPRAGLRAARARRGRRRQQRRRRHGGRRLPRRLRLLPARLAAAEKRLVRRPPAAPRARAPLRPRRAFPPARRPAGRRGPPGDARARRAGGPRGGERAVTAAPYPRKDDDAGLRRGLPALAGAAGILMVGVVASRALGFVRNAVLASYFGGSPQYEAYVAAIAVPDAVFQVLAGGVMGAAFIPVFARYLAAGDERAAWRLSSSAINLAALLTGGIAVLLIVFARPVMGIVVSGRDAEFQELATGLVRIMLVSPFIFAISGFATSILNTFHRFFWAALAPLMYNLGIIAGTVLLHDRWGIYGVAVGVAAGACAHLLIQVPGLLQVRARYWPVLDWRNAGVREVGTLMLPRMFGLGVAQANQLITNIFLASFLVAGSMAYLNYAWLVLMLPLGVFGMAVSTAVFPTLARQSAAGESAEMGALFSLTLRMILFVTIPAAVGLIVLAQPIVRLLFERGSFTPALTQATALALAVYTLGLPEHS